MPVIVGLTGGIGSGKTTVASSWSRLGAYVIDADAEARAVLAPGTLGLWLVRHCFGDTILTPSGVLDRASLASIVFADARARAALNARTHPLIIARMLARTLWALFVELRSVVVLDTPLLFETRSLLPFCGKTVVVYCREEQQVERAMARGGNEEDVRRRIGAQIGIERKRGMADVVVDNSGRRADLDRLAGEALRRIRPRRAVHAAFCGGLLAVWGLVSYRLYLAVSRAAASK